MTPLARLSASICCRTMVRSRMRSLEDTIDADRRAIWLEDALKSLTARELDILRHRRLVENAATLESLGDRLGISKERVRQIESRALDKLRRALIEGHPEEEAKTPGASKRPGATAGPLHY